MDFNQYTVVIYHLNKIKCKQIYFFLHFLLRSLTESLNAVMHFDRVLTINRKSISRGKSKMRTVQRVITGGNIVGQKKKKTICFHNRIHEQVFFCIYNIKLSMKFQPGVSEISLGSADFVYTQLNSRHVLLMPAGFNKIRG